MLIFRVLAGASQGGGGGLGGGGTGGGGGGGSGSDGEGDRTGGLVTALLALLMAGIFPFDLQILLSLIAP
jgi:hypothetical protein